MRSREESIIDAAFEMFVARGFAKTTTAEIAAAAGVAEGTLYLYFNNKEGLARAVLAAFYKNLTAAARTGVKRSATTRDKLAFLARHHLKNIVKARRLLEIIVSLDRDLETYEGSDFYAMNREYVAVFDEVAREGCWRGEIPQAAEPWVLRDIFFGSLDYAMRSIVIKRKSRTIEQVVDGLVATIMGCANAEASDEVSGAGGDLDPIVKRLENVARRMERAVGAGASGRTARDG
ncbi:MAG: TetR/AcrR family transcriptional regulator [Parvularculaceae bacterium]|nr:TetR/AcrR family transcriptional regulator [Parvularculaceae bacterium]